MVSCLQLLTRLLLLTVAANGFILFILLRTDTTKVPHCRSLNANKPRRSGRPQGARELWLRARRYKLRTTTPQPEEVPVNEAEFVGGQIFRDVALIVPYRDRPFHLRVFTHYMHSFLSLQNISFHIYIVEQAHHQDKFNRAMLLNIGAKEAMLKNQYNCLIFHDVDLLPEMPSMTYACGKDAIHMSVAVDIMNYSLPYKHIFGGVSALTPKSFQHINGFSNVYWGWGGEDDDIYKRLSAVGIRVARPPPSMGRYTMLRDVQHHATSGVSEHRYAYLHGAVERMYRDGLNSLDYVVLEKKKTPLFTRILVDIYRHLKRKRTKEEPSKP